MSMEDINLILKFYGASGPDAMAPGYQTQVKWKQFAIDFDEAATPKQPAPSPSDALVGAMQKLRATAVKLRLDMTDAFEEYAGSGNAKNTGTMCVHRIDAATPHPAPPRMRCSAPPHA